jgi:hypothetical protein
MGGGTYRMLGPGERKLNGTETLEEMVKTKGNGDCSVEQANITVSGGAWCWFGA